MCVYACVCVCGVKCLALHSDSVWLMVTAVTATSLKIAFFYAACSPLLFFYSLSHSVFFKIPEPLQAK